MAITCVQSNKLPETARGSKRAWKQAFYVALWVTFWGVAVTSGAQQAELLSAEELKLLACRITAAQTRLSNIKIESEMWVETKRDLQDPCEPWERTPIYVSASTWLNGLANSKAKVEVHKHVVKTAQSPYPYSESSYSVGFDGEYGTIAYHTQGRPGKTLPHQEGKILLDRPKLLNSDWCERFTGRRFTSYFFFEGRGFTFSDLFEGADDPNTAVPSCFEFMRTSFQGVPCIKIASKGRYRFRKSWWLDPSRGFALLGHEYIRIMEEGAEHLRLRIHVTKLKEIGDGIWWPTEAYQTSEPFGVGEPWERSVYRALNVVANDPNFDESIFTVPFPDGYLIDDQVAGRKYKVGQE